MRGEPGNIKVRKATSADLKTLLEFEQAIIRHERPFDPTLKKDPIRYYDLGKMLEDSNAEIIVAEVEGQIVASGYAQVKAGKIYEVHEKYAYLGFMYVVPEFRGNKINALIIERLKEFARSRNLHEIRLEVYHKNEAAIIAYEKSGFERHIIEMRSNI